WFAGSAAVTGLFLLSTLTVPGARVAPGLIRAGDSLPIGLLLATLVWAAALGRRSAAAAGLVLTGGTALAFGMMWLRADFFDVGSSAEPQAGPGRLLAILTGASSVTAAVLILHWGGNPFRVLAAGAFAFLAVQAVRNAALFGLVAGTVLAGNLGEWADQ